MVLPLTIELQPTAYSTRISKVEFHRFDGKNIKEWLYKCTRFFSVDGTTETFKVRFALYLP